MKSSNKSHILYQQVKFSFFRDPPPQKAKPFLKWAGGKSYLLPELLRRMPGNYGKYIEPFLGGGALFFAAQPEKAILIDANYELIAAYTAVRDNCKRLITELAKYSYDKNRYYEVREWDKKNNFSRLSVIKRAGRLIFLNKTCFNGLYRVNSQGHFNVPFGRYSNPRILDKDNLLLCSKALKQAQIIHGSYGMAAKKAKKNDFVYFDPPYAALSKTSSFASYTLGGFSHEDQIKLQKLCIELDKKGVKFMLSNSYRPDIVKMYSKFNLEVVLAPRAINSKSEKRGKVKEIIVRNYK